MNNKIIIDVYDINPNSNFIIIKHPTGIFYTSQCGGLACLHPLYEGYIFKEIDIDFDDCELLCWRVKNISINEAAKKIDNYLFSLTKNFLSDQENLKIRFDYDNIQELEEGCWPVIINWEGTIFGNECKLINKEGIIFKENCD